jgi:hypothetical protein
MKDEKTTSQYVDNTIIREIKELLHDTIKQYIYIYIYKHLIAQLSQTFTKLNNSTKAEGRKKRSVVQSGQKLPHSLQNINVCMQYYVPMCTYSIYSMLEHAAYWHTLHRHRPGPFIDRTDRCVYVRARARACVCTHA